jgi:hypothetical protein
MYDPKSHTASPTASRYAAWAIVVMVLSGLLAVSTGLCTGAFVVAGLTDTSGGEMSGPGLAGLGLMLGGPPCLIGIGMFLAARKWGKRKPPKAKPEVFE